MGTKGPAASTHCGSGSPRTSACSSISHRPATGSRTLPLLLDPYYSPSSYAVAQNASLCTCALFPQENVSIYFCPHPLSSGLKLRAWIWTPRVLSLPVHLHHHNP